MSQLFILSPAKTSGERADLIYNPGARFSLALRLRAEEGVPLGEVFSFLSGLYFRGKLTYAKTFARPSRGIPGILVITSNRGLLPASLPVTLEEVRAFSDVPVDIRDERYLRPLERDAELLARVMGRKAQVVFLSSIGTRRYVEPLLRSFGERLLFPAAFVGRGDMSRGGLLLRSAAGKCELEYAPLAGAVRHGKRPEKLSPRRWGYKYPGRPYERVREASTKKLGSLELAVLYSPIMSCSLLVGRLLTGPTVVLRSGKSAESAGNAVTKAPDTPLRQKIKPKESREQR